MQHPKSVILNVNRYIAKYNFEIARKLAGSDIGMLEGKQKLFNRLAMLELFQDISKTLNGYEKDGS